MVIFRLESYRSAAPGRIAPLVRWFIAAGPLIPTVQPSFLSEAAWR